MSGRVRRHRQNCPSGVVKTDQPAGGDRTLDARVCRTLSSELPGNPWSVAMTDHIEHIVGSGNVFADLGLPNPEERLAKAQLAYLNYKAIQERSWTQAQTAEALGIDQPKVSALLRGRLSGFSLERLFRFLNALGQDVAINVRPNPSADRPAGVTVAAA
jgi:predicted XRE-type DNA-binding protein